MMRLTIILVSRSRRVIKDLFGLKGGQVLSELRLRTLNLSLLDSSELGQEAFRRDSG